MSEKKNLHVILTSWPLEYGSTADESVSVDIIRTDTPMDDDEFHAAFSKVLNKVAESNDDWTIGDFAEVLRCVSEDDLAEAGMAWVDFSVHAYDAEQPAAEL